MLQISPQHKSVTLLNGFSLLFFFFLACNPPTDKTQQEDFRNQKIVYTKHAKCRMQCRYIDESEIKEILKYGKLNNAKSNPNDKPCPSFALEGITHDNQSVRVILADCDQVTKVITVIDLVTNYSCDCK